VNLHLGLNALIRSLAFYRNESVSGREYFDRLGLPDEASAVFGEIYWHHLRGDEITPHLVGTLFEQNWCVISNDDKILADELAKDYSRYRDH
jgi:hypothetical protein